MPAAMQARALVMSVSCRYDAQMGDHWWLLVVGVAMWAVIIAAIKFGKNDPNDCPRCGHDDSSGRSCQEMVDANGWASGPCGCADEYHASHADA